MKWLKFSDNRMDVLVNKMMEFEKKLETIDRYDRTFRLIEDRLNKLENILDKTAGNSLVADLEVTLENLKRLSKSAHAELQSFPPHAAPYGGVTSSMGSSAAVPSQRLFPPGMGRFY